MYCPDALLVQLWCRDAAFLTAFHSISYPEAKKDITICMCCKNDIHDMHVLHRSGRMGQSAIGRRCRCSPTGRGA